MFEEKVNHHTQTLVVDGCKVAVHYNEQQNPRAIREIKSILLSAPKIMELWKICKNSGFMG